MQLITAEDKESMARIRHALDFAKARRGTLAITVDLRDAERLLATVVRLGTEINQLTGNGRADDRSAPWQHRANG